MNLLAMGRSLAVLWLFISAASAVSTFASSEEQAAATTLPAATSTSSSSSSSSSPDDQPSSAHARRSLLAPGDNIMVPLEIDGPNIIEGAREVLSPRARREQQQQQQQQAAAAAAATAASQQQQQQQQQQPAVAAPPQIPFVGGAVVSPPTSTSSSFKSNSNNKNPIAQARDSLEAAAEKLTDRARQTAASAADAAAQLGEDLRSKLPDGPPGDSAESPSNGAAGEPRGFIWLPGPEDAGDTSDPNHPGWIRAPKPDTRPAIGVWAGLGIAAGALLLAVVGVAVAFGLAVKLRRARGSGGGGSGSGAEASPTAAGTTGLFGALLLHRSSTQGTATTTATTTPAETPRDAAAAPA